MSLPTLTENLNNISTLPDKPSISATELKALFDKAPNDIKDYINDELLDAIEELCNSVKTTIDNSLDSTSTIHALSALQGKNLKDLVDELDSAKQKKITCGTSNPSGGANGDIYIQYFN